MASADKKDCLTCGIPGASISTFTRVGNSRANSEPLINLLCCILKKSVIEIQLHSDAVCEKCFRKFENIEKLQYKLSEACREVIQNFNHAVKVFMKSDTSLHCEESQCLLVLNDINLKTNESGIIAKAVSLATMKKRERRSDITVERKHQCSLCGKTFRAYSHKVEHMVIHTQVKSFKCDVCGLMTTTKSNLKKHKQQHTHDYICNICNKKLCSKFSLKEHMAIHSNSRPFQCEYCEKTFLRPRDKKIHEKNHLIEFESYECEVCERRFALKSRLSRHMLVHCKEKQFICSICDKKFARKDDLKCHERIHSGDKPYSCKECGKQFRFISNCRNHMKSHSKETKMYRCNYCNISFLLETKYKSHLKTRNHRRKTSESTSAEHVYCDRCKTPFTIADYALHRPVCGKKKIKEDGENEQLYCSVCCISFASFDQLSEHTLHSHVDQGIPVLSQTNETRVLLSTVGNNTDIVDLTPLHQFTVTGESVNMVVSVDNNDTSLQIPVIQNTSSALHPLNIESKSGAIVSGNQLPSNMLSEITSADIIAADSGMEPSSVDPSASATSTVSIVNPENLFKISDWDMNSYCQKLKD